MTLKLLSDYPVQPMSYGESALFLRICLADAHPMPDAWAAVLENIFVAKILHSRIPESARESIDVRVLLFVSSICDRPGTAVMWAYTLYRMSQKPAGATWDALIQAFPDGFPTERSYEAAWDAQKGFGGNLLDQAETWK